MAATRKLQGEIDRCLKKVTEGVETFQDIWQKVHNATNSNQKEKYEADLKKEIKKLQRLRDQIKSWIASGEIKDKSTLYEYRKLIETQMERFKVVERETKTKAYSKEGLGAAQKLDPAQKEREEISCWLVTSIDALNLQLDQFESEIESLLAGKKKRLDKDKQDRMEELKGKLEKHRFHIKKLETLLRMLDNMSVEVDKIRRIKDDVEYYVESSQDPDFNENEYIYDDIIIDEIEPGIGLPSSATTDSNNSNETGVSPTSITSGTSPIASPSLGLQNHSIESLETVEKKKKIEEITKPVKPMAVRASNNNNAVNSLTNNSAAVGTLLNNSAVQVQCNSQVGIIGNQPGVVPPPAVTPAPPIAVKTSVASVTTPGKSQTSAAVSAANNATPASAAIHSFNSGVVNHNSNGVGQQQQQQGSSGGLGLGLGLSLGVVTVPHNIPASLCPPVSSSASVSNSNFATILTPNTNQTAIKQHNLTNILENGPANQHHLPPNNNQHPSQHMLNLQGNVNMAASNNTNTISPSPVTTPPRVTSPVPVMNTTSTPNGPTSLHHSPSPLLNNSVSNNTMHSLKSIAAEAVERAGLNNSDNFSSAFIPPILGVAPLGTEPLKDEQKVQFQLLEASYFRLPHPSDMERARTYLPRTVCQTPLYYNQVMLPHSDTVDFFQRLSTETLFFVFYYMEGTKAQYLAARALKKQSWRFHTKYMMWFQRHEEPKIINEEYEQGTYIYFDYEKWGQRKKEGFTFEYKYLEDRDLN